MWATVSFHTETKHTEPRGVWREEHNIDRFLQRLLEQRGPSRPGLARLQPGGQFPVPPRSPGHQKNPNPKQRLPPLTMNGREDAERGRRKGGGGEHERGAYRLVTNCEGSWWASSGDKSSLLGGTMKPSLLPRPRW